MASNKTANPRTLLKPGWWVALTLKPDTAPHRCYVGQIQAIEPDGVRITLVDWITGQAAGFDLFVPRENIQSALVATEEHDLKMFGPVSGDWQDKMNHPQPRTEEA